MNGKDQNAAERQGSWMQYCGMAETGDPGSSASVDEIVYGPPTGSIAGEKLLFRR